MAKIFNVKGTPVKNWDKVLEQIKKKGSYSSKAHKKYEKGQGERDKEWEAYTKERSERYKRDGITE